LVASAIVFVATLSACGGGGGGGGGGGSTGAGSTPAASLTAANSTAAAQTSLKGLEILTLSALTARSTVSLRMVAGGSPIGIACPDPAGGTHVITHTDADNSGTVSAGDTLRFNQTAPCLGVLRSISQRVLRIEGSPQILDSEVEFAFQFPATGETLSGKFVLNFSKQTDDPSFLGRFADRDTRWSIGNVTLQSLRGSARDTFTNVSLLRTVGVDDFYSYTYSGRVESNALGLSFDFTTPALLAEFLGRYPTQGELVLRGSTSRVRLRPRIVPGAQSTADIDFDGSLSGPFAAVTNSSWESLVDTTVFGVTPNRAPILSGRIIPNPAGADDDLEVDVDILDFENDPVTLSFEWRRNGITLTGAQSQILPAGQLVRGDTVTAIVTASDGKLSSSLTLALVIADSPPEINAPFPDEIRHGDLLRVPISVTDVDGDPTGAISLRIAYGPSGMTLDAAGRLLSWPVDLPMFDDSVDVNWSVAASDPNIAPVSGTIRVSDPGRDYVLMHTGNNIPIRGAMQAGDFDSDGDDELLVMGVRGVYEFGMDDNGEYRQLWAYPFSFDPSAQSEEEWETRGHTLAQADVDGDGLAEFFVATDSYLVRLDGATRRETGRVAITELMFCSELEAADLDGDSAEELVCFGFVDANNDGAGDTQGGLILDPRDLSKRLRFPNAQYGSAQYGLSIALGNVDADPATEIVTSGGYLIDGASLQAQWISPVAFGGSVAVGDVDGDGIGEIVAADNTWVRGYSAVSRSQLWSISPANLGGALVADVIGDARAEVILAGGDTIPSAPDAVVTLYGLGSSGVPEKLLQHTSSYDTTLNLAVGDFDGDGALEIARDGGTTNLNMRIMQIIDVTPSQLTVQWENTDPRDLNGPFRGGEIVRSTLPGATVGPVFFSVPRSGDNDDGRLARIDPDTGELVVSPRLPDDVDVSANVDIGLAVSDYDLDGTDEIIVERNTQTAYALFWDFFSSAPELTIGASWRSANAFTVDDMTGDGRDDLVSITANGELLVHNPVAQALVWNGEVSVDHEEGVDVIAVDLDANGRLDIVAATDDALYAFMQMANGTFTETIRRVRADISDIVLHEIGPSGQKEIVALANQTIYRYNTALQQIASTGPSGLPGALRAHAVAVLPATPGRRNYLVAAGEFNGGTPATGTPLVVLEFDPETRQTIWASPVLTGGTVSKDSMRLVEIGGRQRIVLGTQAGMFVTQ
jgi:hypothetical protein